MVRRAWWVLWMAVMCTGLRAQHYFERLGRADGLPGDQVLALFEDRDGFIWIGTESGLARHEGVRVRTWFHDRKDPTSIPNNVIWDITADEYDRIWIATDHGLCRYDARTGGFERVFVTAAYHDPTSANRIHRVRADGAGLLWLSTDDGIHTIALKGRPHQVPLPDASGQVADLVGAPGAGHMSVDTVRHGIWITTTSGILFRETKQRTYVASRTPQHPFAALDDALAQCATPDGSGGIWYYTDATHELVHSDRSGTDVARYPVPRDGERISGPQFLALDAQGRLWMSSWLHELRVLDIASHMWTPLTRSTDIPWSLSSRNAKSWLQDRTGRIWIGTYKGLCMTDPRRTDLGAHLITVAGQRTTVECLMPVDSGTLMIGTQGSGVIWLDRRGGTQRVVRYAGSSSDTTERTASNFIGCIHRDSSGWMFGSLHGLLRADPSLTRFERPSGLAERWPRLQRSNIRFIEGDSRDQRWIGTWGGGLYTLDVEGAIAYFDSVSSTPLPSRKMLSCTTGKSGTWIGFNDGAGMCRIVNGRVVERALHEPDSTGANYGVVNALAEASDGTLYIGTLMGGLGVRSMTDGSITWYTRSDGLPGDRIEQLVLDHGSGLWIRTQDGLCRFDRSTHAIDRSDPPASMLAFGGLRAIALDADGSLLCAYGPLVLDLPTITVQRSAGPDVIITTLRFGGHTLPAWSTDSIIELRHDARAFSAEFGVRSFFHGQAVRFAYRVEDLDSTWRALGGLARLDVNDLPPGAHRVEVRANSGGSGWTPSPLVMQVHVLPPFWSTWWFRVSAIMLFLAFTFIGFKLYLRERLRQQREQHEREQAVLTERMRIAGDMHDDLGAGLSALKLRSEMALRVEKDPQKREQLSGLAGTAGDLIGSMRQIIWTMNQDQASVEDLVVYTSNYARTYCAQNALDLDVKIEGPWPHVLLSTEQRRNMFLVVKEALHNTVKHARATAVHLDMRWSDGVVVELRDNGIGLPKGTEDAVGNGLRNMRKRIGSLGGSLSVNGEQGASIHFHVPMHP